MPLFSVPKRAGRDLDSKLAKKANTTRKTSPTVKGGGGLLERINSIKAMVEKNLGHLKDDYEIIMDYDRLVEYIESANNVGIISIDTETTGLDPIQDNIVGVCLYTLFEKAAYVPINHVSYVTNMPVPGQLSEVQVAECLKHIKSTTDVIMFNAPFDLRVIKNHLNIKLRCKWDCYLAARLLNENEETNKLKPLHQKYVLNGEGDAFTFDSLFKGITFDKIPIKTGYIYAAHDAIITYELYEYQKKFLDYGEECKRRGLQDVAWVFHNIEMPIVDVVVDMEDTGVDFDMEYNSILQDKYHNLLEQKRKECYDAVDMYSSELENYKLKNPSHKLSDPLNLDSPSQLAVFFYDIVGVKVVDEKSPRGTGEKILQQMDNPLAKHILEYRSISKLVGTYIDKLPNCINPKDGRIHCKFNQYGADTGRFSSNDPNLQNIPSHNKDIRKMFKATDGYVLMSSDYSQQEPKCLAALCARDGDPQMLNSFLQGKDLYSEIASKAFNTTYENCLEFRPDGTTNPDGKNRRSQAKSILLGVLYGRGVPSIAEQLGTTVKEAGQIKESVFRGFPAIKKFEEDSINMAKTKGFVTTVCGRKRRLPSMMLPDYEFKWKDGAPPDDDPLGFDDDEVIYDVPIDRQRYYLKKLRQNPFKLKRKVFEEANREGIWIKDNTMDKDTTKVVNARIQGSAADLTKLAMIRLHNDPRLKDLGFRMLIPVHDEIIAECPEENVKECAELLASIMSDAAQSILKMPIKCDVEITKCWYGESIEI